MWTHFGLEDETKLELTSFLTILCEASVTQKAPIAQAKKDSALPL